MNKIYKSFLGMTAVMSLNNSFAQCPTPTSVTASPSVICPGQTTSLNATAAGASINWYTVGVGGTPTGTSLSGGNFTTTAAQTTTYYAESFVSGSFTFSYTGGLQSYTIPAGVTQIDIESWGAEGGTSTGEVGGQNFIGGRGAYLKGTYTCSPGQVLTLLVGGRGLNGSCGSGGGGGSFIVRAGTLLQAAGGGGGGFHCNYYGGVNGGNGLVTTAGGNGIQAPNNGPQPGFTGGINGNGGSAYFGGGGGGYFTAGVAQYSLGNAGGAYPGNGGTPGGGYGGGGGHFSWCCGGSGGGGGYSGGSGGVSDGCAGGGGGSYNSGTNQINTPGVKLGNGQITLSYNSCVSASRTAVILTVNPTPTITVNSGSICAGNSFTINPNGAATYTIQGGNAVVSPTANTNYTVIGTSSVGCVSSTFATSSVSVNALPLPTISVNSGSICAGQSFTMNPSGAATYTFEGGNAIVSPTANTTYTVVGTNSAGCVSSTFATSSVTVAALPSVSVSGNNTICVGESATLTANGANSYSWNTGASSASIVVSPTTTTTYSAQGTSSLSGCSNTATFSILVSPCTGVAENTAFKNLSVYPNPNNGEFVIELPNGMEKTVVVTDVSGRVVKTINSKNNTIKVNISDLAPGIYHVKVSSDNKAQTLQVIKQ